MTENIPDEKMTPETAERYEESVTPEILHKAHAQFSQIHANSEKVLDELRTAALELGEIALHQLRSSGVKDPEIIASFENEMKEVISEFDAPSESEFKPHTELGVRIVFPMPRSVEGKSPWYPIEKGQGFSVKQGEGENQRKGLFVVYGDVQGSVAFTKVVAGSSFELQLGTIGNAFFDVKGVTDHKKNNVKIYTMHGRDRLTIENIEKITPLPANDFERSLGFGQVRELVIHAEAFVKGVEYIIELRVHEEQNKSLPSVKFQLSRAEIKGETGERKEPINEYVTNEKGVSQFGISSETEHLILFHPDHELMVKDAKIGEDELPKAKNGFFIPYLHSNTVIDVTLARKNKDVESPQAKKTREDLKKINDFASFANYLQSLGTIEGSYGKPLETTTMVNIAHKCVNDINTKMGDDLIESLKQRRKKEVAEAFTRNGGVREKYIELIDNAIESAKGKHFLGGKEEEKLEKAAEDMSKELRKNPKADIFWTTKEFLKKHSTFIEKNNELRKKPGPYNFKFGMVKQRLLKEDPVLFSILDAFLQHDQYTMRRMMREAHVRHGAEKCTNENAEKAIKIFSEIMKINNENR